MARIELAPEVLDDFDRILDHLASFEVASPGARIDSIVAALDILETSPLIGRPVPRIGLRELVIGRGSAGYVALYQYVPTIDTVFVLAVRAQREAGYKERRGARRVERRPALLTFNGAVEREPAIDAWFDARGELGSLARTWFTRMRRCGSDVRELLHDGCPTACVGDAPFASVAVHTAHVNIGFFHGATLPDPAGLLEGTGKSMRHVKLRPGRPMHAPSLTALVKAAHRDIVSRLRGWP